MELAETIAASPKRKGLNSVTTRLASIEWDFTDANARRSSIHAFHSYPARFIPEIPRTVIRELAPPEGTLVFDPDRVHFSGPVHELVLGHG